MSALVACLVFAHASRNEWALDDEGIVERNPAAHSFGAAARSFFSPYWPVTQAAAGQYRPAIILSYGLDWSLSGGNPVWFHVVNILLHGVATALVVTLVLAWLPPIGAAVAGVVFALHPVHVESVANVVGRAELVAAIGLLGLVLFARRYREALTNTDRKKWATLGLVSLTIGLFAKEHAVVGIAVVALDEWCDREGNHRRSASLYIAIAAVTIGWLYLWRAVAGEFVEPSVNATIRGLEPLARGFTMLAVQPEIVRLLTWPMDLAADYNPQAIMQRTGWSIPGVIGFLNAVSISTLGLLLIRRAPAVAFGILAAVITYSPTSNFLFPSGVVLAERTLYMAAMAPAFALGWLATRDFRRVKRAWVAAAVGILCLVYAWRAATRVPVWKDSISVVAEDFVLRPDNYRARMRVASYLRGAEEIAGSLAEILAAGVIFPDDPFTAYTSVPRALELGYPTIALSEARRAHQIEPANPRIARLLSRAYLALDHSDSAAIVARTAMENAPESMLAARTYAEILAVTESPAWRRHLVDAAGNWRVGWLSAATRSLDSAAAVMPQTIEHPRFCWDLRLAIPLVELLTVDLKAGLEARIAADQPGCNG